MNHPQDKSPYEQLLLQVMEHLETRWAYLSLTATEKAAHIAANLAGIMTIFIFAVLVLFFFSLGFGWWLGDILGNRAGGFALAGLVFIPIGALAFRRIKKAVLENILKSAL